MSLNDFFELIKEDLKHHGARNFYQKIKVFLFNEGFQLLFNSRLSSLLFYNRIPLFSTLVIIILKYINLIVFSSIISVDAKIGKRFMFKHPIGMVFGSVVIGDDVNVFQQITLGSKGTKNEVMMYPEIKNNVTIYAHSILIGAVVIESNVIIAANSVVINSLKEEGIYAGSPAKKIN